jgi:phytoene dehydrogenase-like protein
MGKPDAIVVGSGPNGLAGAVVLALAGLKVRVLEAEATIGGGARSAELTLPGFVHDTCSAIHPLGYSSPLFRRLPLQEHGLKWIHPKAPLAHPLDDGSVAFLENSIEATAKDLESDADAYANLLRGPTQILGDLLKRGISSAFRYPLALPVAGFQALRSISSLARSRFRTEKGRALVAGLAGHSMLPFDKASTSGIVMALAAAAHAGGWPFPEGGAQKISDALGSYLGSLGGEIETNYRVGDLGECEARVVLLDVSPRQFASIAGERLPSMYARVLRNFRYGEGAFKVDWALSQSVPWRNPEVARSATCHIGGSFEEICTAEREPWFGRVAESPFLIAAQPSLFDPTRAPTGKHTLWGYCHVPNGSTVDMLDRMERQIERFAPGFRDCILARHVFTPRDLELYNANLVGGDIAVGSQDLLQLLIRPNLRYWSTPLRNVYLCSASTPPGAGVHGMCGYFAAALAMKRHFGLSAMPLSSPIG